MIQLLLRLSVAFFVLLVCVFEEQGTLKFQNVYKALD